MPSECKIVEAITTVHPKLKEVSKMRTAREVLEIGSMTISSEAASWKSKCDNCAGWVLVKHTFGLNEDHVEVQLPDSCPSKPATGQAPTLYIEELPDVDYRGDV